jgi:hypothetical protein
MCNNKGESMQQATTKENNMQEEGGGGGGPILEQVNKKKKALNKTHVLPEFAIVLNLNPNLQT